MKAVSELPAGGTAEAIATKAGAAEEVETVHLLLERLAANAGRSIVKRPGPTPFDAVYSSR
jgi:hypothetical protein